jgi:glycosyltransferase involved in cell wall biosynthesis
MPTVVIEALALKVPVLCTAVGGVPSLFGKHEHLLIKPRSASSITEAVKGYLEGANWQEDIAESYIKRCTMIMTPLKMPASYWMCMGMLLRTKIKLGSVG